MRTKIAIVSAVTAIPLALSACGASGDGAAADGTKNIGFISQAPRNDGGFTQFGLAGVNAAVEADKNLKLSSIVDNAANSQEQIQGLESLAAKNQIVVADGASFNKAVAVVAPKYPKVHFILVAADLDAYAENVTSVSAAVGYNAIVVGAVASAHSRTKKLGMIAGLQVPASGAWYYGMAQGAALENPNTKVVQTYTGDYNDVGKAKQAAEAMIASGVDSILSDLDSGSGGVYQAVGGSASPADVYDVFALHCDSSPHIIGSGVVSWSDILKNAVSDAAAGKLPAGAISYGLGTGALRFEFCPGKGTAEEKGLVEKITKDITDGKIVADKGVLLPKPAYHFEQR
ncbi:BMP family protein [Micromonospora sp. NPDC006431]|uniref:BMP family lipoprotein n=1 Tax=Micromonospora sp. NPDC006431 TaxID=3364235 RepID=UPI0036CEC0A7